MTVTLGENNLSGYTGPKEAQAYDIAYYIECYSSNACNVLCQQVKSIEINRLFLNFYCKLWDSARVLNCLVVALMDGKVVGMAEVEAKS